MSRIGKKTILIPEKTSVNIRDGAVLVKGPLGEISRVFKNDVDIKIAEKEISLAIPTETLFTRALWGTYASHIQNMVQGVNEAFKKNLIIEGVGYKAEVSPNTLTLHVGFSHPVKLPIPHDVKVSVEKNFLRFVSINKESLGQFVAHVRSIKKPEPYKGKGIRYEGEVIRRKQGKKAA